MNKPYHKDFDVPLHAFKQHDKDLPERPLVLNDVYIGARGTLFNEQKEVVYINSISKQSECAKFNEAQEICHLEGEFIYMLCCFNLHVWGHIREDLSRLSFFDDENFKTCTVLKNIGHFKSWPELDYRQNLEKHLEFFGYPASRQRELAVHCSPRGIIYKVDALHLARRTINPQGLVFLREKWMRGLSLPKGSGGNNKIYLSRPHKQKQRSVLNDSEVRDYLKGEGFYIWSGEESFEEQVRLFRDADIIIGPHGAAFFNCLFCQRQPLVLEFMPSLRHVPMWKNQSHMLENQNHKIIECQSDENFNHKIEIDKIKYELSNY